MAKIFNVPDDEFDALVVGEPCQGSPASAFTVSADGKGVLLSRMTNAQMLAIVNPPSGLLVFNTSFNRYFHYNGVAWVEMGTGAGGGAGHLHIQETLLVAVDGQTNFTLSQTPIDDADVIMTVNGVRYEVGSGKDYTISGTTATWLNADFALETTDEVIFSYEY